MAATVPAAAPAPARPRWRHWRLRIGHLLLPLPSLLLLLFPSRRWLLAALRLFGIWLRLFASLFWRVILALLPIVFNPTVLHFTEIAEQLSRHRVVGGPFRGQGQICPTNLQWRGRRALNLIHALMRACWRLGARRLRFNHGRLHLGLSRKPCGAWRDARQRCLRCSGAWRDERGLNRRF